MMTLVNHHVLSRRPLGVIVALGVIFAIRLFARIRVLARIRLFARIRVLARYGVADTNAGLAGLSDSPMGVAIKRRVAGDSYGHHGC